GAAAAHAGGLHLRHELRHHARIALGFRLSLFPGPDDRLRRPALSLFQAARLALGKAGFSHTSVAPPTGAACGLDPRAIFRERPSRKGSPAGPRVTPVGSNCVWKVFRASLPRISL